ncbi:MAG: hypothetical protein ACI4HO_08730 [Ruminococcus sp.]
MEEKKTTAAAAEEIEMGQETDQALLRRYENDILGGLLEAANYRTDESEIVPIQIIRKGQIILEFRIRPLSEEEYTRTRDKYTKYVRNKNLGIRVPENTDTEMYRNALIYEATVEEDQANVWRQKDAWKALNVVSGPQLIGKVLKAGEKDAICDKIDQISGYTSLQEEAAKN